MTSGDRVRQARELRGITQVALADALSIDQSAVAHIETGRHQPSLELARRIALFLGFPTAFFEQQPPTPIPIGSLLFRSLRSTTSHERTQARRYGELIFELARAMSGRVRVLGEGRLPQPQAVTGRSLSPTQAAHLVRAALALSPDGPIPHLTYTLERRGGVLIAALPVHLERCDAYSAWVGDAAPIAFIVLSGQVPGDRLRFSLAHEVGHLVLHNGVAVDPTVVEAEAHAFASEFLMPAGSIYDEFPRPLTLNRLAAMKPRWGVSIQALIMRAKDLEIVSERHSRRLFQRLSAMGWRTNEPMALPPEKPRAIRRMAESLYGTPPNMRLMSELTNHIPVNLLKDILARHASAEELPARRLAPAAPPQKVVSIASATLRRTSDRAHGTRRPTSPAS